DIHKLEPEISPEVHSGYLYPNDWQVENRKLLAALRRYCELNGIEFIENTSVSGLIAAGGEAKGVETARGEMHADRVIITTGAWTAKLLPTLNVKPVRGQMISLAGPVPCILHRVIYSQRGYLVPRADGRMLVGATVEDVGFTKEVTLGAIASLKAAAIEIAPGLDRFSISEAWAGLRPFVEGELPVIGRVPDVENAFVATGHYRNGILLAPITAKMIADEMLGVPRYGVPESVG
ncbi:MAG: FAD-dependent oxidoreductase, partial [bacterium]|nr:FAD-dependent oxidoreductase [bacterium]